MAVKKETSSSSLTVSKARGSHWGSRNALRLRTVIAYTSLDTRESNCLTLPPGDDDLFKSLLTKLPVFKAQLSCF